MAGDPETEDPNEQPPARAGALRRRAQTRPCRECAKAIPSAALRCSTCGSYQDRRRFVFAGSGMVTALVALAAPLWAGAYSAWSVAFPKAPEVAVEIAECRAKRLHIYMWNSGGSRALLQRPQLYRYSDGIRTPLDMPGIDGDPVEDDDLALEPGEVAMIKLDDWAGTAFEDEAIGSECLGVEVQVINEDRTVVADRCKCEA